MEIQTYPTGTPSTGDVVPYVEDPTGTPALKLADVADLAGADGVDGVDGVDGADGTDGVGVPTGGTTDQVLAKASGTDYDTAWVDAATGGGGGSGLTWTQVVDEDGSSLANWTTVSGTWASSSGHIECTADGMLLYDTDTDLTVAVYEAEVQAPTGGGDRYGGIATTAAWAPNYTHAQYGRIQRVSGSWVWEVERGAIVAIASGTLAGGAVDTWFKLRLVFVGSRASYFVDGTFVACFDVAHDWAINRIGLVVAAGSPYWFRNMKLWTADLGLPA